MTGTMQKQGQRIVAISNGAAVLENGFGPLIDSFEHVVRFNGAPLADQYAPHVGIKTTIWACSDWPSVMYRNNRSRFADCRRLFVVPDIPGKENVQPPPDAEAIPRSFERQLRDQVQPRAGTWCTTGLITLAWLLREFEAIHTVGWFQLAAVNADQAFQQHYDAPDIENLCCNHDVCAEARFFQRWIESGRITELDANPDDDRVYGIGT